MKIPLKKLLALSLIIAVMVSVFGVKPGITKADTVNFTGAGVTVLDSLSEFDTKAFVSWSCELKSAKDNEPVYAYASFTLYEDSYIRIGKKQDVPEGFYASPTVTLYSDPQLTKELLKIGNYTEKTEVFLPKGTYFLKAQDEKLLGADHMVTIRLTIGAVPQKNMLKVSTKTNKNKTEATVTVIQGFDGNLRNIQYIKGNVPNTYVNEKEYWMVELVSHYYSSGYKSTVVKSGNTFTVTKNGTYTVRIENEDGNACSIPFSINSLDDKAPVITGVTNGKTYRKPVVIRFGDKGSGVKKAALNGKTIKTNKKVSKNGSYTLKVTDRAGNSKTVKFKIKIVK